MNTKTNDDNPQETKTQTSNGGPAPGAPQPPQAAPTAPCAHAVDYLSELFPPIVPWPDPVKGDELLDDILALLKRFVVLPKWAPEALTLFDLHTYAYYLRDICAYIAIESPEKECGKSTLVTVLSHLVHRPVISSNISSSASFHAVEELNPTLLIDEGDTNLRRNAEFRGILNAGYSKPNAYVWRVAYDALKKPASKNGAANGGGILEAAANQKSKFENPKSSGRLARFTCWCPKLIASIGRIHDVLASRCIVIRMHRKTDAEECERTRFIDTTELRRKCVRFIQDNADAIAKAQPAIPAGLSNRAADIWEPLFVLADLAGGRWPQLARQAAIGLTATAQERNPIGALLLDILIAFTHYGADRLFSSDLVAFLNNNSDRPWVELRKGKAIDEIWLAKQLRPYGIRPSTIRIGAEKCKGYLLEDFQEIFKRYISRAELEALKRDLATIEENPTSPQNPIVAAGNIGPTPVASACSSSESQSNSETSQPAPEVGGPASTVANSGGGAQASACSSSESQSNLEPPQPAPGNGGPVPTVQNQNSKIENGNGGPTPVAPVAEVCLCCTQPLDPVPPGQPRTQIHCHSCGTSVWGVPVGTSVREKCPKCGEPQPIHGYTAERMNSDCISCGTRLPVLKPGPPTPWLPR